VDLVGLLVALKCKQQTVKSPNEHGNTLGNQPAERYKLLDRKTEKPLKSGETTHGESRYLEILLFVVCLFLDLLYNNCHFLFV
jgi:hypothetical protein